MALSHKTYGDGKDCERITKALENENISTRSSNSSENIKENRLEQYRRAKTKQPIDEINRQLDKLSKEWHKVIKSMETILKNDLGQKDITFNRKHIINIMTQTHTP
jgi:hypothetical protein